MGDEEDKKLFCCDHAKMGTSKCKKCKEKIEKGALRLGKIVPNPFTDSGGDMKQWFHPACLFDSFLRARATTKKIEQPDDIDGWHNIEAEDQDIISNLIQNFTGKAPVKPSPKKPVKEPKAIKDEPAKSVTPEATSSAGASDRKHKDNAFREFRKLCANIADESGYINKTKIVQEFITKGTSGNGFMGDLRLWIKLLLPGQEKRIYNLQSKQLVKLFSQLFSVSQEEMLEHLDLGDVSETVSKYFEESNGVKPAKKSLLSIHDVDDYLEELKDVTREDKQMYVLKKIASNCTPNDLKMVIRLIKHDIRINAGSKHILEALSPDAYPAYQASRNLNDVITRIENQRNSTAPLKKGLSIKIELLTPVQPMLAQACKSVKEAVKKCSNGMYAELKYDGERVQVHKKGNDFKYYSRSLKPVMPHKVNHFKEFIPKAFPHGRDVILDSEVLLIDTTTGKPLPFGSLGKHKKEDYRDANVCLFVFDCLFYNGESLLDKPIKERREILYKNMTEIPNRIMFSEMKYVTKEDDLQELIMNVIKQRLEGLVLKDIMSIYEPGKRHWLKVKKDYLEEGSMADTADLVVLGAWYGTGRKGGLMSVYLMGCYDTDRKKWCTVTKVGGHDDDTMKRLQEDFKDFIKISKDPSAVPHWLDCSRNMVPDLICPDPKKSPVWEIAGAELTKTDITHTAGGISIRFPRVARIRDDKDWSTATTVAELKELYKKSLETTDVPNLFAKSPQKRSIYDENDDQSPMKKSRTDEETQSPVAKIPQKRSSLEGSESDTPVKKARVDEGKPKGSKTSSNGTTETKKARTESDKPKSDIRKMFQQQRDIPEKPSRKKENDIFSVLNDIPNIFSGFKISLDSSLPDYESLKRYVIAYDGDFVDEFETDNVIHVVSNRAKPKKVSGKQQVVTDDWLKDCIKLQKVISRKAYLVT